MTTEYRQRNSHGRTDTVDTGILTDLVQAFGPTSTIMLIVVVFLIREKRNGKNSTANPSMGITQDQMSDMRDQVKDLHEWQMPQMLTELKGIRATLELVEKKITK